MAVMLVLETLVTGLPSGIEFINNGGGGIDIFGTPSVDINVTTSLYLHH